MRLALTTLCENPLRPTGLTTYFRGFVNAALEQYPNIEWIIFASATEKWPENNPRVQVVRRFPANDQLLRRLWADHFEVPVVAKQMGADALLTVGFVPLRKTLPTAMMLVSLQHIDPSNKVGGMRQLYRRFMTRSSLAKADLVITNSAFAASQIQTASPELKARLIISHEGFDQDQFVPAKEPGEEAALKQEFRIEPGFFLWVSNFYAYKQAHLLLQGYAQLEPEFRSKHPLVMAGGGWEGGESSAQSRAKALGIETDVHFLGWIEERWLAPLYRNAAAFCLASREETFGKSVIEAMRCGTPCVVNDIPIMHEVTAELALIVDFKDKDKVATALRRVASDPELRDRLRTDGLRRGDEFSFDKMSRERIDAISEVLTKLQR